MASDPNDDFDSLNTPSPEQNGKNLSGVSTSAMGSPTVFADACLFATRMGGTVRLTFVETILEPSDVPNPGAKTRHVGTLVLPVEGYKVTLSYLNSLTATLLAGLPDVD